MEIVFFLLPDAYSQETWQGSPVIDNVDDVKSSMAFAFVTLITFVDFYGAMWKTNFPRSHLRYCLHPEHSLMFCINVSAYQEKVIFALFSITWMFSETTAL